MTVVLFVALLVSLVGVTPARAAGPSNDEAAGALRLDTLYLSTTNLDVQYNSVTSTNVGATKAPGELNIAGDPGGASVWFLQYPGVEDFPLTIDTVGSDFPTLLAVYRRELSGALTLVGQDKGSAGGDQSRIANIYVPVPTNGFLIVVDGVGGATGAITLRWYVTPPANDDLANAQPISGASGSLASTINTSGATVQPNEPDSAPFPTFNGNYVWKTIWFRWTAPATGRYGFDAGASTPLVSRSSTPPHFLPRVDVFTGTDIPSLSAVPLIAGVGGPTIAFAATAGTSYAVRVGGLDSWDGWNLGHAMLAWGPAPANDDFANAQALGAGGTVTGSTIGATLETGEPEHTANQRSSVWFTYTASVTGSLTFDIAGSFSGSGIAAYTGATLATLTQLGTAGGPFTTNTRLTVLVHPGDVLRVALAGERVGPFTIAYGIAAPPNDEAAGALRLDNLYMDEANLGVTYHSITSTNVGATKATGELNIAGDPGGASVWFLQYPAVEDIPFTVDTVGSDFPTLLAVYRRELSGALTLVGQDKGSAGGGQSRISDIYVPVPTNGFLIVVDGVAGATGAITLRWYVSPPANDDLANAQPISGASGSLASTVNNAGATVEPNEPGTAPFPTFNGDYIWKTIWYRWTAPTSGLYGFDAARSTRLVSRSTSPLGFLPRVRLFTGADIASLVGVPVVAESGLGTTVVAVTAGTTYDIQVGGLDPFQGWTQGHVMLAWNADPANDDFANAQTLGASGTVQGSTLGATLETGEPSHTANQRSSVWFTYTAPSAGSLSLDIAGSFPGAGIAAYRGSTLATLTQLGTAGGPFTSNTRLVLPVHAGDVLQIAVSGERSGPFTLAYGIAAPPNDEASGALRLDNLYLYSTDLGTSYYSITSTNLGATKAPGELNIAGDPGGASVWFLQFPGVEDIPFTVDTVGSDFPTLLAVYQRDTFGTLTLVGQDKGSAGGGASRVSNIYVPVPTNGFLIVVDGVGGASGTIVLRWYVSPPANDDLANAQPISGASGSLASPVNTSGATVEPNEPGTAPFPTFNGNYVWKTIWYRWTAPASGVYGFDAGGSTRLVSRSTGIVGFLPRVDVFTGSDIASLVSVPLIAGSGGPTVAFAATAGTAYDIRIGGLDPFDGFTQGHAMLAWAAAPANDDFANAQLLGASGTTQGSTIGATLEAGEPQHTVNQRSSVWFRFVVPANGTLNVDVAGSFPGAGVGAYRGATLNTLTQLGTAGGPFNTNTRLVLLVHAGDVLYFAVAGERQGPYTLSWNVVSADTTGPAIAPTVTGALGTNGWYVGDVTVNWTVTDPESNVDSSSGCGTTIVTTDTTGVDVTCSATSAGGTTSQTVTIKRDAQAPTIIPARSPAANAQGWSNGDVSVSFTCADATSLVAVCSSAVILVSEGADQQLTGNATDNAGNAASLTVSVSIDRSAPLTTASPTVPADASGASPADVQISLSCTDALSGCARTEWSDGPGPWMPYVGPFGFAAPGTHTVSYRSIDNAGNVEDAKVATYRLDATPPVITPRVTGIQGANGWYVGDVLVTWSVVDPDSTVSVAGCDPRSITADTAGVDVTCSAKSAGGESDRTVTIKRDTEAPTIVGSRSPLANARGWSKTDVTVTFTCTDALSLVATCSVPALFSGEGAGQSATGTATDGAGNAASTVVTGINLDKTAPVTTATPSAAPNGTGIYPLGVAISLACADALSGCFATEFTLDGSAWTSYGGPITLTSGGAHVLQYRSTDRADNAETARTATYRVGAAAAPEASLEFDPRTLDLVVRGRAGAIVTLVSTVRVQGDDDAERDQSGHMAGQRRTYRVTNSAGGWLEIVVMVQSEGHQLKAHVVSLRYSDTQFTTAAENSIAVEWSVGKNGEIKTLEQTMRVGREPRDSTMQASYDAKSDRTTIRSRSGGPESRRTVPGVVVLKMVTDHGALSISSD